MNRKYFMLLVCVGIITTLLLLFYNSMPKGYEAKVVSKIPEGFVPLYDLNERVGIFRTSYWDDRIAFCLTPEEEFGYSCIYNPSIENSDYFVKYKGMLYVNEAKYMKLVEVAVHALELRQRTYNLGEEIEVLAGETIHKVKIISVEAFETKYFVYTDSITTYHIKYAASFNLIPNEHDRFIEAETKLGIRYTAFNNIIDKEMLSIKIRAREKDDRIETIILTNPYYTGLIYRIVVDAPSTVPSATKFP